MDTLQLSVENPTVDFKEHLSDDSNKRILFSGRFGSGKTYFLNTFFENNDEYEVVRIFPVNYSVSSNEDIFELVKYDVLFELIRKGLSFEKVNFSKFETLPFFISNNYFEIAKIFIENFTKTGKDFAPVAKDIVELIKKYNGFHKSMQINSEEEVIRYLQSFSRKQGNIYEEDGFSLLIAELLEQIQSRNFRRKVVLIVDDLDRIDPEHIFRLLNVFAAHFDIRQNQNKFDFDKVIFVCDVENVRNIFQSKYGQSCDFSGYIDKFYSKTVFNFDNSDIIESNVLKILQSIKLEKREYLDDNNIQLILTAFLLTAMVKARLINMRLITKLYQSEYTQKVYALDSHYFNNNIWAFFSFDFLAHILGGGENLRDYLNKSVRVNNLLNKSFNYERGIDSVFSIIAFFELKNNNARSYLDKDTDMHYNFSIKQNDNNYIAEIGSVFVYSNPNSSATEGRKKIEINLIKLSVDAVDVIRKHGFLH
jgi:hypothetical protein